LAKKPPHSLSANFDREIMEIGIITSNLIENSHYSCNPGQNQKREKKKIAVIFLFLDL
jgi:hypothetical protein